MNNRQIALKLMLKDLGVDGSIDTQDDRKRVQKAVYLGQVAGADLGYRFSWYLMGPYSPSLTRDYYDLAESAELEEAPEEGKQLKAALRQPLLGVKSLLNPPKDFKSDQSDWLELLASYHYLRKVSGKSRSEANDVLAREKKHLVDYADLAREKLREYNLLG